MHFFMLGCCILGGQTLMVAPCGVDKFYIAGHCSKRMRSAKGGAVFFGYVRLV